jgi:hypothetical protein
MKDMKEVNRKHRNGNESRKTIEETGRRTRQW